MTAIEKLQEMADCAKFEALVAERLAKSICVVCPDNKHGLCVMRSIETRGREYVERCRMKHARIAIEQKMEEMEAQK